MNLTLVGTVKSRALRVLWLLEELGAPYTHVDAGPRSEEARAYNPAGKIPVLVVDGETVTDSVAIMTFLADVHGQFTHPAGTVARARQDAVTQFIVDELDGVLWMAAKHSFSLPEDMRVPAVKESLRWEFERSQARLGEMLADGDYLTGNTPTIPDFLAAHCTRWATNARFPLNDARVIAHRDRMMGRAAFRRLLPD